jgi:hypothetical protein
VRLTFLDLRTRLALKKNKALRATIPYSAAKQIGILFTVDDQSKHHLVKNFISRLQADGKEVQVLEFLPKKKDNPEFRFDFFTAEDLNFWGRINSVPSEKFCQTKFDFLFNIDTKSNPLIRNMLANCKAHCRVGRYEETASPYFELMIETNGSVQALIDNMYEYAKKLR